MKNSLARGKMFQVYVLKLGFRLAVFLLVLWAYFKAPEYFDIIVTEKIEIDWILSGQPLTELYAYLEGINHFWVYLVWGLIMIEMVIAMLPDSKYLTMGSKKEFPDYYVPVDGYDRLELYQYVQKNNLGAMWTLIVWMCFNAVFGALYVLDIIAEKELLLLCVFFYLADLICVVIWCPFQSFFLKNKCCVNCRIFNWGHFMMCTPLLFIRNFFTWSLFFTSLIVMLRWEITLLKHPERFWEGSNATLKCANCQDKICKVKGPKFMDRVPKSGCGSEPKQGGCAQ